MQHVNYPLPPLMLAEVIERARHDHEHRCCDCCAEDTEYCSRARQDSKHLLDVPDIVSIQAGYGRHECDDHCETYEGKCFRSCDDSDWIVELRYSAKGYHAIYGIKRHGDVQDVSLWAD